MTTIRKTPAGNAPGVDGWRYDHYRWASGSQQQVAADSGDVGDADEDDYTLNYPAFVPLLADLFTLLATRPHLLCESSWRLIRAASLTAVGDKRRPIACAGVFRRLLSSTLARKMGAKVGPQLERSSQYGAGVSSGVEKVAVQAQSWHQVGGTVIQLDCKDAFNTISRTAIIYGLEEVCPELLPLSTALYC